MGVRIRGAASRPRLQYLGGVPSRAQKAPGSAGTATRGKPGPAAPPLLCRLAPSSPLPGLPLVAAKTELFSPRDECCLQSKLFGAFRGADCGSVSWQVLSGRLHWWSGPSHLPGPRLYLHGCNGLGATSPGASAPPRPGPRDAALARAPAVQSAAREPGRAARPRGRAQLNGFPARALGRKTGGLVTCPRRSRNSSSGKESFQNIRGIKKSPPHLSSSNRLSKNISSTTEKTARPTLDDDQPCDFFKKGSRVSESHQKSSSMDAGRSWNKVPRWKNASGKRQSESGGLPAPSRPKGSLPRVSPPAGEELGGRISPEGKAERSPLGPGCRGPAGNKLLLDFQSLRLMKEDSEEDSASDLSDSERVPVPPSPRSPPDLHLRAEEIDPVCFDLDLQPGQGHARPEYCYPDFLPPPCNSWDLRDMAVLANTEPRPAPGPRAGGLLGKYVDRLVQLEWLQILTVQGERAKAAKARLPPAPGTAPGPTGPLKSPGRSKPPGSAGSRPHQDGAPRSGSSRKKGAPREGHPPSCWSETPAKPLDVLGTGRLCSQKHAPGARAEEKRSGRSPRPRWDLAGSGSSRRMESSSNLRGPAPPGSLDAADPPKASRTQAHANPRKKGNADNCSQASLASEKKLKTNGGKQNPRKFK